MKKYFLGILAIVAFFTTTALGCDNPNPPPPPTTTASSTTTTTIPPVLSCVAYVKATYSITLNDALGPDPTVAHVAKPIFTLNGNGGISKYSVTIDGASIGTFNGDGHGIVCIQGPSPLSDGSHVLKATELAPNPAASVVTYNFSIDTVAPVSPVVTGATVSGTSVRITGTSTGIVSVRLFEGQLLKGGSSATTGTWSVTILNATSGSHTYVAVGADAAGNTSPPSSPVTVLIA